MSPRLGASLLWISHKATRKANIYAVGALILEIVLGARALGGYHESFQLLNHSVWMAHWEWRLLEPVDNKEG